MQSFTDVAAGTTLNASRQQLTDNDKTIMSCSSGTAFPTLNTQVGMLCFRTDENKLYQLKDATPTWVLIADLTKDIWSQIATATTGINTYAATLAPAPAAYTSDQLYVIKFGSANTSGTATLNLNALGAKSIKRTGGANLKIGDITANMHALLAYDGLNFILLNHKEEDLLLGVAATGTNTYAATLDPIPTAYVLNKVYLVQFQNANTAAAVTVNLNSLGPINVKRQGGLVLKIGDIAAGMMGLLHYNGTDFILLNRKSEEPMVGVLGAGTDTYTATLDPVPSAYVTEKLYHVRFPNANTITNPTINLNSLGTKTIKKGAGRALAVGDIEAGMTGILAYNGTDMILLNPAKGVLRGKQTAWIPAGAMYPRTTNGSLLSTVELATNKVMLKGQDFDPATQEYAQFDISMPKGWDEGTVTAKFVWTASGGTVAQGVVWGIQAQAFSDGEALDAAFGTAAEVTDALLSTTRVKHDSGDTAAVTIGNTPAARDLVKFQVYRKAADAGDTLTVDATLLGVELTFNFDAADDA
jgi:hypothetical protein